MEALSEQGKPGKTFPFTSLPPRRIWDNTGPHFLAGVLLETSAAARSKATGRRGNRVSRSPAKLGPPSFCHGENP